MLFAREKRREDEEGIDFSNRISVASHDGPRLLLLWSTVQSRVKSFEREIMALAHDPRATATAPRSLGIRCCSAARDCAALLDGGMGEATRTAGR